jgi:heme A synthase
MAGVFVIVVAQARNWSLRDLREVHAAVLAVVLAGVLVLAVGLGIQARSAMGTPEDG